MNKKNIILFICMIGAQSAHAGLFSYLNGAQKKLVNTVKNIFGGGDADQNADQNANQNNNNDNNNPDGHPALHVILDADGEEDLVMDDGLASAEWRAKVLRNQEAALEEIRRQAEVARENERIQKEKEMLAALREKTKEMDDLENILKKREARQPLEDLEKKVKKLKFLEDHNNQNDPVLRKNVSAALKEKKEKEEILETIIQDILPYQNLYAYIVEDAVLLEMLGIENKSTSQQDFDLSSQSEPSTDNTQVSDGETEPLL